MPENTGQKIQTIHKLSTTQKKQTTQNTAKQKLRTSQEKNNDLELLQVLLAFLRSAVTVKTDT